MANPIGPTKGPTSVSPSIQDSGESQMPRPSAPPLGSVPPLAKERVVPLQAAAPSKAIESFAGQLAVDQDQNHWRVHGGKIQYFPEGVPILANLRGSQPDAEYPIQAVKAELERRCGQLPQIKSIPELGGAGPAWATFQQSQVEMHQLHGMVQHYNSLVPEQKISQLDDYRASILPLRDELHQLPPAEKLWAKAFVDQWVQQPQSCKLENGQVVMRYVPQGQSEDDFEILDSGKSELSMTTILAELALRKGRGENVTQVTKELKGMLQQQLSIIGNWDDRDARLERSPYERAIKQCNTLLAS